MNFHCSAGTETLLGGYPSIHWDKNGEDILLTPRVHIDPSDHALVIYKVRRADSGLYTCTAKLKGDSDTVSAELIVEGRNNSSLSIAQMIYNLLPDVPDPPSNVHLTSPCHTRITELHWHSISDNHPPVSHFIIQYNTSFNPEVWSTAKKLSTGDRHYDRISLSPWGNYSFRVIARNSVGDSLPSEPSAQPCSTPPDVPHHNPSGICTKNAKPHQLVITWKVGHT